MCPFYLAFYVFAEECSFSSEEEKVFVLCMVEHFDGVSLKDILQLIVFQHIIRLSALLVNQAETVHRVNFDSFGNVYSLFDYIFPHLLRSVVWFEVIEVDESVAAIVGQSQDLVVGQVIGEAEAVEQHEVDIFWFLLHVFEGVVNERTKWCIR